MEIYNSEENLSHTGQAYRAVTSAQSRLGKDLTCGPTNERGLVMPNKIVALIRAEMAFTVRFTVASEIVVTIGFTAAFS